SQDRSIPCLRFHQTKEVAGKWALFVLSVASCARIDIRRADLPGPPRTSMMRAHTRTMSAITQGGDITMGDLLTSKLFTGADVDDATKKKLQDCAHGRPREVASHFSTTANRSGSHIILVQEALKRAQARDPSLKLPPFAIDGVYSKDFADAVFVYKQQR